MFAIMCFYAFFKIISNPRVISSINTLQDIDNPIFIHNVVLDSLHSLELNGGRGGIRTHEPLAWFPVFKTGALNHYATLPKLYHHYTSFYVVFQPFLRYNIVSISARSSAG